MKSRIKKGMAGILLIVLSFAWAVGLKLSNAAYAQGGGGNLGRNLPG